MKAVRAVAISNDNDRHRLGEQVLIVDWPGLDLFVGDGLGVVG